MNRKIAGLMLLLMSSCTVFSIQAQTGLTIDQHEVQVPILNNKHSNALSILKINTAKAEKINLNLVADFTGSTNIQHLKKVYLFNTKDKLPYDRVKTEQLPLIDSVNINGINQINFSAEVNLKAGENYLVIALGIDHKTPLSEFISFDLKNINVNGQKVDFTTSRKVAQLKVATGVRFHQQDNVHTSRIPGLATTHKGTLIAIFDARYERERDLQGHMDIALHRSTDGGQTWQPMQIALDKGEWGGLPQRFNGVSDAAILVDKNSDKIFIAGLWMYGVINEKGEWIKNLTDTSTIWNHQWRTKGSQPGYGVKQTSQFLITQSSDDGLTWSEPQNITKAKNKKWWLFAPGPGNGITMENGTLVFPSQGRNEKGVPFSNVTYSKDGGKTWKTSNAASHESTTEAAVVQLNDGSLMLNMRGNKNRENLSDSNGRVIATTTDLGKTWTEHPTSSNALIEPTCMGSLYKHFYQQENQNKSLLFFSNPSSKSFRNNFTLKVSTDDGNSWPEKNWVLLDDMRSRGYSSISSVNEHTIGILYESGSADLIFQTFTLEELNLNR
ncbi:sialidase family protein [Gynurincola endophyticus]|uniref:sialidase family protein n=1 Tax=Gynurincola endophyticus TaxID=2479004 RepID=UPI0018F2C303|nr:sialidase family protein [Gynurincola endophyticus]